MWANMNRFANKPEVFNLYVYRDGRHRGVELSGPANEVMVKAKDIAADPETDEVRVTDNQDRIVFDWDKSNGVLFPKKGVDFSKSADKPEVIRRPDGSVVVQTDTMVAAFKPEFFEELAKPMHEPPVKTKSIVEMLREEGKEPDSMDKAIRRMRSGDTT